MYSKNTMFELDTLKQRNQEIKILQQKNSVLDSDICQETDKIKTSMKKQLDFLYSKLICTLCNAVLIDPPRLLCDCRLNILTVCQTCLVEHELNQTDCDQCGSKYMFIRKDALLVSCIECIIESVGFQSGKTKSDEFVATGAEASCSYSLGEYGHSSEQGFHRNKEIEILLKKNMVLKSERCQKIKKFLRKIHEIEIPLKKNMALESQIRQETEKTEILKKKQLDLLFSELSCCICYKVFVRPVRLPCLHTFCQTCVLDFEQIKKECPLCGATYFFRRNDFLLEDCIKIIIEFAYTQNEKIKRAELVAARENLESWLPGFYNRIYNNRIRRRKEEEEEEEEEWETEEEWEIEGEWDTDEDRETEGEWDTDINGFTKKDWETEEEWEIEEEWDNDEDWETEEEWESFVPVA